MTVWRRSLDIYCKRPLPLILALGFASGLPLPLTFSTLSAWLASAGVRRAAIGAFALAGIPYAFKFLWSPLVDRLPPPLPLGRRRGWGVTIQLALAGAIMALGRCDPRRDLATMGALALLVAFLSASQDIVIDAYRVELLSPERQGPGAGMIQTGYRIAMLVSGAGALLIAARYGWSAAYAAMAALMLSGTAVFLLGPEPVQPTGFATIEASACEDKAKALRRRLATAVAAPFKDFMARPMWFAILIFIVAYKLGEAMAGVMAMPLYVSIGFSLDQIAAVSKFAGFFATVAGALIGGAVTARLGFIRALIVCGLLQSAGNLFYVLQVIGGRHIGYLALCVAGENLTGAMAGAALVAYLSSLCSRRFTATQYALLSSLAAVGRTLMASAAGILAETLGWPRFFLLTTAVTLPALLPLVWIGRGAQPTGRDLTASVSAATDAGLKRRDSRMMR